MIEIGSSNQYYCQARLAVADYRQKGLTGLTAFKIYQLTEARLDAIMFGCLVSLTSHLDLAGRYLRVTEHRASSCVYWSHCPVAFLVNSS